MKLNKKELLDFLNKAECEQAGKKIISRSDSRAFFACVAVPDSAKK